MVKGDAENLGHDEALDKGVEGGELSELEAIEAAERGVRAGSSAEQRDLLGDIDGQQAAVEADAALAAATEGDGADGVDEGSEGEGAVADKNEEVGGLWDRLSTSFSGLSASVTGWLGNFWGGGEKKEDGESGTGGIGGVFEKLINGDWQGAWDSFLPFLPSWLGGGSKEDEDGIAEGEEGDGDEDEDGVVEEVLTDFEDTIPPTEKVGDGTGKESLWFAGDHTIDADMESAKGAEQYFRIAGASLTVHMEKYLRVGGKRIPGGRDKRYAFSGRRTPWILENVRKGAKAGHFNNVRGVSLLLGGNDIGRKAGEAKDYGDVWHFDSWKSDVLNTIEALHAVNPGMKVVLVSMPPVMGYVNKGKKIWEGDHFANKRVLEIREWMRKLSEDNQYVEFVDVYPDLEDPANLGHIKDKYNLDGLHVNDEGSKLIAGKISGVFNTVDVSPREETPELVVGNERNSRGTEFLPYRMRVTEDGFGNGGALGLLHGPLSADVPAKDAPEFLVSQMQYLKSQGFTRVVCLDSRYLDAEIAAAAEVDGIDVVESGVSTSDVDFAGNINGAVKTVMDLLAADEKVYVHCQNGAHRAPFVATCVYLQRDGLSLEDALAKAGAHKGNYSTYPELFKQVVAYAQSLGAEVDDKYLA
jgi:lysophospholipase L1-like esterase